MALKQRRACRKVVGLVRRAQAARQAYQTGAVDEALLDPAAALSQADVVVFSTPVRVIMRQLAEFSPLYKPAAVITDMGSTKQEIVRVMGALPEQVYPVGSHPMCGKEKTGLSVAEATLFEGAPWVLTPLPRTPPAAVQLVQDLALAVGAKPQMLEPDRHDRLVAAISHLPYTLAAALVLAARQVAVTDPAVWQVAASGFKDTSRVAASDVTMMLDILLTNRAAVGEMLALAQNQLEQFARAIAAGDAHALQRLMEQAATQRKSLYS